MPFNKWNFAGIVIAGVILCLGLISCRPSSSNPEIIHANLGGKELFIPREYVKFGHTSVGNESALIQAWYPGFAIVPGNDPAKLLKQEVWWKNIMILISSKVHPTLSFHETALKSVKHLGATEILGAEYGLIHQTQAPDGVKDNYDVWFEMKDNQIISYITCSESLTKNDHPQCQHYFRAAPDFLLQVSYNRKLLSEWKTIKNNVIQMLDSFQSQKAADSFVKARMSEMQILR